MPHRESPNREKLQQERISQQENRDRLEVPTQIAISPTAPHQRGGRGDLAGHAKGGEGYTTAAQYANTAAQQQRWKPGYTRTFLAVESRQVGGQFQLYTEL